VYGISQRSIRRIIQARGYYVYKACKKTWIDEDLAPRRKKWAVDMLEKYLTKESWWRVRFSDESHGSYSPEGTINVLRKAGQREHPNCIQRVNDGKHSKKSKEKQDELAKYRIH